MALAQAILALLVQQPLSGYDLNKKFSGSIGNFWKATQQQIYRELTRLEDQGSVESEAIAQAGRPDKKLFRITPQGRQQLTHWIEQPCDVSAVKEDVLVKVFVGRLVSPSVLQQEIQRHRQIHQSTLDRYQAIATQFYPDPATLSFEQKLQYLVLRRGIRYEREWIVWCDEVLDVIGADDQTNP